MHWNKAEKFTFARLRIWGLCNEAARSIYSSVPPDDHYADLVARLLFGTCAQESGFVWERQRSPQFMGNVGGFGKWQIEPATIETCLGFLRKNLPLAEQFTQFIFADPHATVHWVETMPLSSIIWALRLDDNDKLACALARVKYWMIPADVPATLEGQAAYYKEHYNTSAGKATPEEYIENWNRLCADITGDWPC